MSSNLFLFIFIFSSAIHKIWILMSAFFRKSFLLNYWSVYSAVQYFLLSSLGATLIFIRVLNQGTLRRAIWLIISGLPPFSIFWLKAFAVLGILKYSLLKGVVFLISSIVAIRVYFRVAIARVLLPYRTVNYILLRTFVLITVIGVF